MTHDLDRPRQNASFSLPSLLAIASAIGSFFVGPFMQIVLAVAAIILGLLGVMISISPAKRGGVMSVISVVVGVLAIVIAIVRAVFGIVF